MLLNIEMIKKIVWCFLEVICAFIVTEPAGYVAQDISVRVMSPQSVLVSWIDPVVELGKVTASETRFFFLYL